MNAGFYLEAISLQESLITDRLESILAKKSSIGIKILTASQACSKLERAAIDSVDLILLQRIRLWSDGRAEALHEFVKLHTSNNKTWRSRISFAKKIAEEGILLIRLTDAMAKRVLRESKG
jgi:hypothetical protein